MQRTRLRLPVLIPAVVLFLAACGGEDEATEARQETAAAVNAVAEVLLESLAGALPSDVELTDLGVETEECPSAFGDVGGGKFASSRTLQADDVDIEILDQISDALPQGRVLRDSTRSPLLSETPERRVGLAVERNGLSIGVLSVVRDRSLSVSVHSGCER